MIFVAILSKTIKTFWTLTRQIAYLINIESINSLVRQILTRFMFPHCSGTGKPVNPDQCMTAFEDGMNTCAQRTLNMDMKVILMVLNGQTLPPGQDAATMKKTICG